MNSIPKELGKLQMRASEIMNILIEGQLETSDSQNLETLVRQCPV